MRRLRELRLHAFKDKLAEAVVSQHSQLTHDQVLEKIQGWDHEVIKAKLQAVNPEAAAAFDTFSGIQTGTVMDALKAAMAWVDAFLKSPYGQLAMQILIPIILAMFGL